MAWKGTARKIDDYRWEIPQDYKSCMRTSAVIFSNDNMIKHVMSDNSPEQAANVACLPGIVGKSLAMPDIHWGYGFPIGGVAAMDADEVSSRLEASGSTSIAGSGSFLPTSSLRTSSRR